MATRDLASMGMLLLIFVCVGSAHSRLLLEPSEGISPSALPTENHIQPVDDWKHDDQASQLLEKPASESWGYVPRGPADLYHPASEPDPWGSVTQDGDDLFKKPASEPWDLDHQTDELFRKQASESWGYVPRGPADLDHPASEPEPWGHVMQSEDQLFKKPADDIFTGDLADIINPEMN